MVLYFLSQTGGDHSKRESAVLVLSTRTHFSGELCVVIYEQISFKRYFIQLLSSQDVSLSVLWEAFQEPVLTEVNQTCMEWSEQQVCFPAPWK